MRFSLLSVLLLHYKLHKNRDTVCSAHHCITHACILDDLKKRAVD